MIRLLSPSLNPTGMTAAAGAVYAGAAMLYNAYYHHAVFSVPVFIALIAAVASLLTRQVVTPVRDPKDGAGNVLVPAPAAPAGPPPGGGSVRVLGPEPGGEAGT